MLIQILDVSAFIFCAAIYLLVGAALIGLTDRHQKYPKRWSSETLAAIIAWPIAAPLYWFGVLLRAIYRGVSGNYE